MGVLNGTRKINYGKPSKNKSLATEKKKKRVSVGIKPEEEEKTRDENLAGKISI